METTQLLLITMLPVRGEQKCLEQSRRVQIMDDCEDKGQKAFMWPAGKNDLRKYARLQQRLCEVVAAHRS